MQWDGIVGPRETLTILSGFEYRFDNVSTQPNSTLVFGLSMLLSAAEPAWAKVTILDVEGNTVQRFVTLLNPPVDERNISFEPFSLKIKVLGNVSVIFSAVASGTDQTAQWIAFENPRMIDKSMSFSAP